MATLNLADAGVFVAEMTVEEVRALEVEITEDVDLALDEAQGLVFTGEAPYAWVVIKVVKS